MQSSRNKWIVGVLCAVVLFLLVFMLKPHFTSSPEQQSLSSTGETQTDGWRQDFVPPTPQKPKPNCTWDENELTNFTGVVTQEDLRNYPALQNVSVLEFTAVNLINGRIVYLLGLYNTIAKTGPGYVSYPLYQSAETDSFDLGARFEMEVVNGNMKRYRQALLSSSREVFEGVWQNPSKDAALSRQMNAVLQLAEDVKKQCYEMKRATK